MRVAELFRWLSPMPWQGKRIVPLLGIDFAADAVRIVELMPSTRSPRIAHCAWAPVPPGAHQQLDSQPVIEALRQALTSSGTRLRAAALALPASAVVKRTLTLPAAADDDELEQMVEAGAAECLPFPREAISLDFSVIGASATSEGMLDVLLVAARSERIAQRIAWAEAAGLKPQIVDVESHALAAAVAGLDAAGTHPVSIIHCSPEGVNCLFVEGRTLHFERELAAPPPSAASSTEEAGLLDSWIDALGGEWQRQAQLYASASASPEVDHVCLAGAGALGEALARGLRQRLGIDVVVPDPFAHWPSASADRLPPGSGPGFLLACGLALRGGY